MDPVSIILLGIVQGITEWVPVSSKTQDTFVFLRVLHGDPALVVPVLLYLHVGTVLAAALYFRADIRNLARDLLDRPLEVKTLARREPGFLFTALLFTGLVGVPLLLLEILVLPNLNGSLLFAVMGAGLIATGAVLTLRKGTKTRGKEQAGWRDGVLTGLFQGLSVLPGVSRAGTSTTGLILRGFDSEASFHLSFLLSIPTVVLAEILFYLGGGLGKLPLVDGLALLAASFGSGYLAIDVVLRVVKRVNLGVLAIALGLLIIISGLAGAG
jgi:undecaprenyl-diphosphatase